MRKAIICNGILLLYTLVFCSAFGQQKIVPSKTSQQGKINLIDFSYNSEAVSFDYSLPFSGVIEVKIFDQNHHLLWETQKLDNMGDNSLRLKSSSFKKGYTYSIEIDYKEDHIMKEVSFAENGEPLFASR